MLTFNLKTTFFTVKTSNEVYCCRIYFVNYIQNVHIIKRTLHGSSKIWILCSRGKEQYLTRSLRSLVRYCSCHSNIKSISSRNRVISSIYIYIYIYRVFRRVSEHPQRESNPCLPIAGSVVIPLDYRVSDSNAMLTRDLVPIVDMRTLCLKYKVLLICVL